MGEILEKYHKKMTNEDIEERLNKIKNEVQNMTAILEDVLIIGRAESGKLDFNPEPIDIISYSKELIKGRNTLSW